MTEASKENDVILNWIPCIYYLIQFKKNKVQALINSGREVNTMTLVYLLKIGLRIRRIDIKAQKIDSSIVEIFKIVLASF